MKCKLASRLAKLTLGVAISVALAACGNDVLDYRNAQIVNGKVYVNDANSPFSGKLTNVPLTTLISSKPGFFKIKGAVESASLYAEPPANPAIAITQLGISMLLLCNAHVKDGVLDGDATCMNPRSDPAVIKMSFSDGALDGRFRYYDDSGKTLLSDATFKSGKPDGIQKVYSPISGNLLMSVPWVDGRMSGTEKAYYGATSKPAYESHFSDEGKLDGKLTEWFKNGTLAHQVTYANGQKNGVEEIFFQDSGKIRERTEWSNGQLDGTSTAYDGTGKVADTKHFKNGTRAYSPEEAESIAQARSQEDYSRCVKDANDQLQMASFEMDKERARQAMAICDISRKKELDAYRQNPGTSGMVLTISQEEMAQAAKQASQPPTQPSSAIPTQDNRDDWPTERNACTTTWENSFHKKNGADAPITYDQEWEFVDNCRAGKRPR
ncbi:lipoprotein [Burkholderia aenigmatica]|uniref:toxin-antitoxin system YwqK family antitoxin n=1 Tax=Burkholderia aenigmatica TaxID=2015348 RepID=UPI0014532862|nr:toxin-antitoxin system YwqK family antitoxin [Burkholderia aenigmatica]VWC75630.1 lipoprotein [Burkholderia aenigmatica]